MGNLEVRKNSGKGERKKVNDPAIFRYSFKLNTVDNVKFEALFRQSEMQEYSKFITSMVFGKTMKVVRIDKAAMDYYMRLTTFYSQYQMIGVNYNQTVKATMELVVMNRLIIQLTREFEEKWMEK